VALLGLTCLLVPGMINELRAMAVDSAPLLSARAASSSEIDLTWTYVSNDETGFSVEQSLSSSTGFVVIDVTSKEARSYHVAGLNNSTSYFFRVRAIRPPGDGTAYSPYSNVAAATTLSPPTPTPEPTPTPIPAIVGVTYYVAASGSDNNPGTESEPFRTIQRAADVVNPGDLVLVGDGIYTDEDGDGAIVMLRRGGTSAALVTFKSRNKWGAKLDGQNNRAVSGFQFGAVNYIRIEGFEIYGVGNGGSGGASGIEIYSGGHNSEIVGNHIHDVGKMCTDTSNGQNGIFVEQPDVVIERNLIHDIGRFALGENGCSPATSYYQNNDHGIYMDGASNGSSIPGASGTVVKNNIFYNNKRGWSIQVYPGTISRMKIYNNTFAFANPYREGHIIIGSSGSDNEIKNNIFYQPKSSAIYFYTGTQTNMVVSNNLTYDGTITSGSTAGVTLSDNVTSLPGLVFVNVSLFDFHLTVSSPALDIGINLPPVPEDFDGTPRPQGTRHDAGAYEFAPLVPYQTISCTRKPVLRERCLHFAPRSKRPLRP
jgi:hypothetical protein